MSKMEPLTEVSLLEGYSTLENCELAERGTSISDVKSVHLEIPHSVMMTVAFEPVETRAFSVVDVLASGRTTGMCLSCMHSAVEVSGNATRKLLLGRPRGGKSASSSRPLGA